MTKETPKKVVKKKIVVKKFEKAPKKPVKKTAFVALIGEPNAGKSTLINRIVGSKISIVTPKVQTTRSKVNGIINRGNSQIVFIDTPGIFKIEKKLKNKLNKIIVQSAIDTLDEVDFVALLVDVKQTKTENLEQILKVLSKSQKKKILIINKVDTLFDKSKLLDIVTELNEKAEFAATFMISALKNNGVDDFIKYIADNANPSEWLYAEEEYTNITERNLAAEITREKLLLNIDKEIPYRLIVETEKWQELNNSVKINQVIFVETEAHKKIIVGKQGQNLKNIGLQARREITKAIGRNAHLFLFVKVDASWMDKRNSYDLSTL